MTTSTHHVELHAVIVTAITDHRASRRILASPLLRIVRADQVVRGDLIVSSFQAPRASRLPKADYFTSGPYPADPGPHDPTCGCGTCGLPEVQGPDGTVVLTTGFPWDTCDPWPADDLVLVLPLHRLPRPRPTEGHA
ncbi:hypothetical protein [Kitasatospora griseola]|uniref:hypothetical protein n=1 Tax=Kitasatospora griseola TaxID=2064 RepID=UPI0038072BC8